MIQGLERWPVHSWQMGVGADGAAPAAWQPAQVPGCWEAQGVPILESGPVWYRARLSLPDREPVERLWLHFGGVSHRCRVFVNGRLVGEHEGIWDPFAVDVTESVGDGAAAEVVLEVTKPVDRDGIRSSLTGFLPYVWGHAFGGLWQGVTLIKAGPAHFEDVWVQAGADGRVTVRCELGGVQDQAAGWTVGWRLVDARGKVVAADREDVATGAEAAQAECCAWSIAVPNPRLWSLPDPYLYRLYLTLHPKGAPDRPSDRYQHAVGLRTIAIEGAKILLNGELIYSRGVLHWGWDPQRIAPVHSRDEIDAELGKLASVGFNLVKHCLYVPGPDYWDACNERGMLAWIELPMWLPKVDEGFRDRVLGEYARILKAVRNHPCLAVITLGCELNREVTPDLLQQLYHLAGELTGLPLIRDNSGSAECYGGNTVEFADFYDYHFYCEPHHFDSLVDAFAPRWREERPTLFGEYLDSDTFRDLPGLADAHGESPWWTRDDPVANPQGVRWAYEVTRQTECLQAGGVATRAAEIASASYKQSMALRKLVLEKTRAHGHISGYVITGIRDTPISTSGILDDSGRLKFPPEAIRAVNADSVLFLGWDRRRAWLHGGDQPRHLDRHNHWSGSVLRTHLVLAAGPGCPAEVASVWELKRSDGRVWARGDVGVVPARPGANVELGVIEVKLPEVDRAERLLLTTRAGSGIANSWPFWVYPRLQAAAFDGLLVWDPSGELVEYAQAMLKGGRWLPAAAPPVLDGEGRVLLTTGWSPAIEEWVSAGGRAFVLQSGAAPLPAAGRPFWREAVKLMEPHPVVDRLAHEGFADVQFYGIAGDRALQTGAWLEALAARGRPAARRPAITRVDARSGEVSDYLVEVALGKGRVLACSLRLWGGAGDQPRGLEENVSGVHLLGSAIRYLAGGQ